MQPKKTWLALGDSITRGHPIGESIAWPTSVADRLGIAVDNQGVDGDPLDGMRFRLAKLLPQRNYECAVWMGGTNDVYGGAGLEALVESSLALAEMLQGAGIRFVVGLPIPLLIDTEMERTLELYRAWIRKQFQVVIDFPAAFPADRMGQLLPDGVHPSAQGYAAMAEIAFPRLRDLAFP